MKLFRNADCTYSAAFGHYLHFRNASDDWEDVDLNFRRQWFDYVMDRHDLEVRINGSVLTATERASGRGVRWILPGAPAVQGRTASFQRGGLIWKYVTQKSGLKLSAQVVEPLGNKTWDFPYQMVGGAADFSVDPAGNLVSDVLSVPRPVVLGANGKLYEGGAWRIGPGARVAFDFDDSDLPSAAFPYELDPTTTFGIAAGTDDGYVGKTGLTYPPLGATGTTVNTSTTTVSAMRSLTDPCGGAGVPICPEYDVRNALVRWDTSSLPDNAVVSSAAARLRVTSRQDSDVRDLTADWYSGWPIDANDYTENYGTSAIGLTPLSSISTGTQTDFTLKNPASNVSKTGFTGLRFHVSGSQPNGANQLTFASSEHASLPEPALVVTYSVPPAIGSVSDSPDPVTAGDPITFTAAWSDPDPGDQVRLRVCRTNQLFGGNCAGGPGPWATGALSASSPATASLTPSAASHGTNTYYAFACDLSNACSSSLSGTFTVNNRTPTMTSTSDSPDPVVEGNPITFSVGWSDPGDAIRAVICKTDQTSGASCPGGSWTIGSPQTATPATASFSPRPSDVGLQTYYAFACDAAGACSSSASGTFTAELGPTGGVHLLPPDTLHSNGADLRWTPYVDPAIPFDKIEVHRSSTASFNPSDTTLLATIRDLSLTAYTDTTATPGQTFTYRLVVNLSTTPGQTVTLPAAGKGSKLLQPDGTDGQTTRITSVAGTTDCLNYGADETTAVGSDGTNTHRTLLTFDLRDVPAGASVTSATLQLYHDPVAAGMTVDLHVVNTAWKEGGGRGTCSADGASWLETQGGLPWTNGGGDFDPTPAASVIEASGEAAGWDSFDITALVQSWANANGPNLGMLLKARQEGGAGTLSYVSDDSNGFPQERPKLSVSYADGSATVAPAVSLFSPAASALVKGGTVSLAASASDDRRVDKVEFLVDGSVVGSDTTAPFELAWNSSSVGNGTRSFRARAIDDVGNTTTSDPVSAVVDNSAMPTASVTSPLPNSVVSGNVSVTADAADDGGISKVQFLMDGFPIDVDTTFPYSTTWKTLEPNLPAYDGTHVLSAAAFDMNGQFTVSQDVSVLVANTALTKYRATITSAEPPPMMGYDPSASQQESYSLNVTVTNTSGEVWDPASIFLRYRWFAPQATQIVGGGLNSPDVVNGPAVSLASTPVLPAQTVTLPVTVSPPALPDGLARSKYRLQFDLFDQSANTSFAEKGNPPSEDPVTVNNLLMSSALGLERYYHYRTQEVGAGMTHLTNVANGNALLRWTPWVSRGRGLSTVLDLTYNSLEASSDSPVGSNWSLSISSLIRMGTRLDIRPHGTESNAGKNFVEFIDGDGTSHRFEGVPESGVALYWKEPAGVHLYLRKLPAGDPRGTWALTRPDRVTFYFDNEGYPTSVEDKNDTFGTRVPNKLVFTWENICGSCDPGGGNVKKRITRVTDAGGDFFSLSYYAKDSRVPARVRGKVQSITDHSGSQLTFDYYDDGNLLRITQLGGTTAEGVTVPSRSFVFTYTTSNSGSAAISNPSDRANPNPQTPNQSTRVFSVRDARGKETTFAYLTSNPNKLKLSSSTDRRGAQTTYAYDINNRLTTVRSPNGQPIEREYVYGYDADGKVTSIKNPQLETTTFQWSADRHLTKVVEPTQAYTEFAYNDNGYLTRRTVLTEKGPDGVVGTSDDKVSTTTLTYDDLAVDANDVTGKWKPGRTIAHISQLKTKTDPNGNATPAPGDFLWEFGYNLAGDLTSVKDPTGATTTYVVNPNGTIGSVRDPNAQPSGTPTVFETYDQNGCPTSILDPLGNRTRLFCDKDGLVRWIQDPLHTNTSTDPGRLFASYFDFDAFHRLARQSTPKSTALNKVIWTANEYDANDNLMTMVGPHEGLSYTGTGSKTRVTFNDMDQPTRITGADISADSNGERTDLEYDLAGRLTRMTLPRGVQSGVADDFTTIYGYDKLDRVTSETRKEITGSASIRRTFYCYTDPAGDLKWVVSPRSNQADTYNCSGGRPSHTTEYGYDAGHRLTSVQGPLFNAADPTKHNERFTYDATGNVVEMRNANGDLETREYDQRNLLTKAIEPFAPGPHAVTTAFVYDNNGNLKELISPRAWDSSVDHVNFPKYTTRYFYDRLNRLIRVELPSIPGETKQYIHNTYDPNSNLRTTSLPTTTLDPALVPDNQKTVMTYFDTGWIQTSNDPGPIPLVRFDYTPEGWQNLRIQNPAGSGNTRQVSTSYFPDGMPKEVTDRAGLKHTYGYDADNNLVSASRVAPNGNNSMTITAEYDGFDQLAQVLQKRQGQTAFTGNTFTHDLNGNLASRVDDRAKPVGGGLGRGRVQTFTYNNADQLSTQIDDHGTDAASDDRRIRTSFLPTGWEQQRIVERANTSGSWDIKQTTDWTYFANGKLKRLVTTGPSGATIESHDIEYWEGPTGQEVYVNGNRTVDLATLNGPAAQTQCRTATPCRSTFTYDSRDRLKTHVDGQSGSAATTTEYVLDPIGNVLTEKRNTQVFRTFEYEVDRLKFEKGPTGDIFKKYFYDPYGNLKCVTNGAGLESNCNLSNQSSPSPNLIALYTHDEMNRLSQFRGFSTPGTQTDEAKYEYDPLDRVVQEIENHNGTANDRTTNFSYLGLSSLVTVEDRVDAAQADKAYGYDAYGNRITMTNTAPSETREFTYAYDTHGSVSALIRQNGGGVEATYGYSPYGAPDQDLTKIDTDKDAPLNPYRYSAKRLDPGSGIYDMGARRYGADPGRFLQQDQFMGALSDLGLSLDPITQNRYGLAGGNPISFIESDGHYPAPDGHGNATRDYPVAESMATFTQAREGPMTEFQRRWHHAMQSSAQNVSGLGGELAPECWSTPESVEEARDKAYCFSPTLLPGEPLSEEGFRQVTGSYLTSGYEPLGEADVALLELGLSAITVWGLLRSGAAALTRRAVTRGGTSVATNIGPKIQSQMASRGWSDDLISEVRSNPTFTRRVWDLTNDAPATAYGRSDNFYVVINDATGDVIQISDRFDALWKPVWNDPRFLPR